MKLLYVMLITDLIFCGTRRCILENIRLRTVKGNDKERSNKHLPFIFCNRSKKKIPIKKKEEDGKKEKEIKSNSSMIQMMNEYKTYDQRNRE